MEIVAISPAYLETYQRPHHRGQPAGQGSTSNEAVVRVNKVCTGGAFGEADFFLARNHSVHASTVGECICWTLTREALSAMEVTHPQLCMLLQHTLLKSLAIAATWAMYALHPTTAYHAQE